MKDEVATARVAGPSLEPEWPDELPFLEELVRLANAGQWGEWDGVRRIYADWLYDRNDLRHWIVRARWELTGEVKKRRDGGFTRWRCRFAEPVPQADIPSRLWLLPNSGAVNSRQLLHFAPSTLRVQEPIAMLSGLKTYALEGLTFTHMMRRSSYRMFDCGIYRAGFLAFFDPEARNKEF